MSNIQKFVINPEVDVILKRNLYERRNLMPSKKFGNYDIFDFPDFLDLEVPRARFWQHNLLKVKFSI